jgi:hypothetical protein
LEDMTLAVKAVNLLDVQDHARPPVIMLPR